jgi:hypothetical protein
MLRALAPFARRAQARKEPHARCDLCGAAIGEEHTHVVELAQHALLCACTACAILFRDATGRYRTVPRRVTLALDGRLAEADWARLEIPVRLAFVVRKRLPTAVYPSPAGPVEAPLSPAAADALFQLVPVELEEEVEALLLHRSLDGQTRAIAVPLDAAYDLIGAVRRSWRGFDGGDHARAAIDGWWSRHLEVAAKRGSK